MYFRNKKSNQDKEVVMPKKKSETKILKNSHFWFSMKDMLGWNDIQL